ncbi:MAG: hypothetical protein SCH70_06640 [Candidatus Methanoperedens sp.]|nr:hypothetical protein [Candidatus Methanoperedens sp.]
MKQIKQKGMALSAMFMAVLLMSMVFMPVVSAQRANEQNNTGIMFTPEELKNLYSKYNITENDIKFAENKLPNFRRDNIGR